MSARRRTGRVVVVASAATAYGGRGAEAEAAGQLAASLHARGARVVLVLPDGPEVRSSALVQGHARRELLSIELGGRGFHGELWRCEGEDGLEVCVATCAELFGEDPGDPGLADLRAGFLAAAALREARRGESAAVLHLHGWAGSVAAVMLGEGRERWHELGAARTVLTLYTPEEPSRFGRATLERLGLPAGLFHPHLLEERGALSFLKGGAAFADSVVLPSSRAAREVAGGGAKPGGVEGALAARGAELRGILHGLDTARWDPQRDEALAAPFSPGRPAGKARCKAALQAELGLLTDAKAALFAFAGEMTAAAGFDLFFEALPKLTAPPFARAQWALVGRGDRALEQRARAAARAHRGTVAVVLEDDERLARRVLGAADFVLFPARRAWDGTWALRALRYGALPVAHATGALAEIVRPVADGDVEGNGVVFRTFSAAALARAVERALALHGTPRLRRLRRAAMESNPSWAGAVRRYEEVFRELGKRAPRRVEIPELPPEPLTAEPTEPYIDWGPPLPERYGEDALELLVQSPRSLYLYWELAAATMAEAGGEIRLRLREAGPVDAVRDLASGVPEMGEWWLEAEPGRAYRAELVAGDGRVLRRSAEAATPREAPVQRGEARWVSHTPSAPAPRAGAARGRSAAGSRSGARAREEVPPTVLPGAPPEAAAQPVADAAHAADAIDVFGRPVEPLPAGLGPAAAPSSAAPPRPPGSSDLAARRSRR